MKTTIVFHSYSGVTRGVAEAVHAACDGELIEVVPTKGYNSLTAYTLGCMRAKKGACDEVRPDPIDVSGSDCVVIGTPVWAWKPTPVINGAIRALKGCEGKPVVTFATCGGKPGDTLETLRSALEERGMTLRGECLMTKREITEKTQELIRLVKGTT